MNWNYIVNEAFKNFVIFFLIFASFGFGFYYAQKMQDEQKNNSKHQKVITLIGVYGGILIGSFLAASVASTVSHKETAIYFITFVFPAIAGATHRLTKKDKS